MAAFLLVMAGRGIRHWLLIGPEGRWRDRMWLDAVVLPEEPPEEEEIPAKPKLTAPLPVNECSVDSLCLLPGVGPVLAGRIDETRRGGVVFRTPDDLRAVKGIGPALSAKLAPLVVFDAAATAAPAPDSTAAASGRH